MYCLSAYYQFFYKSDPLYTRGMYKIKKQKSFFPLFLKKNVGCSCKVTFFPFFSIICLLGKQKSL